VISISADEKTDEVIKEIGETLSHDSRNELIEVMDYMSERGDWDKLLPKEREKVMEDKWMEIKWRKYNENEGLGNLNMGEATLLTVLEMYGYTKLDLKKLMVKFGDVGSVAEYVKLHPKQHKLDEFL